MQIVLTCTALLILILQGCKKNDYNNPYDSSVDKELWAPRNLKVSQTSLKTALLKWDLPDPRIDSCCIEAQRGNMPWKVVGYSHGGVGSFIDSTFVPDPYTSVQYRVHALAWKNNSGIVYDTVTPYFRKPSTPTALRIPGIKVRVSWLDVYTNEDAYKIEKKVPGGNWVVCADTISANASEYYDTAPELNTQITYRLSARAAGIYSDTASCKVSTQILPPTWFMVNSLAQNSCRIEWLKGDGWTTGYNVDRQIGNGPWVDGWLKLDQNTLMFTDSNFPVDQDIKYRVSTMVNNALSPKVDVVYGLAQLDTITVTNITFTTATVVAKVKSESGNAVTEWGFVYSKNPNPTTADTKVVATTGISTGFTSNLTGLLNGTTYYVRAYAINRRGESYGPQKVFTSNAYQLPKLDVTDPRVINYIELYLQSKILSDGGAPLLQSGFVCSLNHNPTITDIKSTDNRADNSGYGWYTLNGAFLSLTNGQTYYVRAYSQNAVGVAYGAEIAVTMKTITLPVVDTLKVVYTDATRVSLYGLLKNNGGDKKSMKGFVYGDNPNPTIADKVWIDPWGQTDYLYISGVVTNLLPNHTYHFRTYGQNMIGTAYGPDKVITTTGLSAPVLAPTTLGTFYQESATFNSQILRDGGSTILDYGFVYSKTPGPTVNDNKLSQPVKPPDYVLQYYVNTLYGGTTYYVKAFVQTTLGIYYSNEITFTTVSYYMPHVDALKVDNVTTTSALLTSSVLDRGQDRIVETGFVYSDNPAPTIASNKIIISTGWLMGTYSYQLTGLLPNHKYYARSYVKNSVGTAYSNDNVFTTLP